MRPADVERKELAILRVLAQHSDPVGFRLFAYAVLTFQRRSILMMRFAKPLKKMVSSFLLILKMLLLNGLTGLKAMDL